ncbi:hypothetical protein [Oricola sp.]|uniref:hypothetical protein n=1 Tax=Oricola sp. TaxID=1979950 RepID=UPI000C8DA72D|nr:hypothetical protein [Ahrensia sp.]MCK5748164.1 hypothetical protein [Oricola sp.]|tara:strand:+ start:5195 stop:5542 length:348 start_codon:yes stop_codon:yes gene_type:complete
MANSEWLAVAVVAGAAILTKPDEASFKNYVNNELRKEFANPSKISDDGIGALIQLGCAFASSDCANFVQSFLRYGTKDYIVLKMGAVRLGDDGLNCVGAFKNWWCFDPSDSESEL